MSYITGRSINTQVGTTYTVLDTDRDRLVTYNNAAAVAVTLPQASTPAGQFGPGWTSYHQNVGTGTVTITPTTSTINGFTAITLFQWETATITSDGTNYKAFLQPISSNDQAANLSGYLSNDAGTGAAHNQIILRNINTGVNANRKGLNIYHEHDGAAGAANYDGLQVNVGFTADAFTPKTQSQTDGLEIVLYGAMMNATFTSVATSIGATAVYTGTIENGANNGANGLSFTVTGFTTGANNGTFTCSASTATTLTLSNAAAVAETHAASAVVASTFTLTSVATSIGSTAVYTGTIPGGASNYYSGWQFRILGFVATAANNGLFVCSASTATTLTLNNANAVAETHAATAAWYTITELNNLKLRWGSTQNANALNNTAILQYLPEVLTGTTLENVSGFSIDAAAGGGTIVNFTGVNAGSSLNGLAFCQTEIGLTAGAFSNPSNFGYGIIAYGKTASIVVNDTVAASSFIGHGSTANGTATDGHYVLHDGWYGFTGSPEGSLSANVGSIYSRQDSTIGDPLYVKASGSGNTGWSPGSTVGPTVTKVATYTATNSDGTILGNGTFTITLPTAGTPTGKKFVVKNIGTGTITVSSAANIDASASLTLSTQYASVEVQYDGTQYWIL